MNASQGEEFHSVSQRRSSPELSHKVGTLDNLHQYEASEKKKKKKKKLLEWLLLEFLSRGTRGRSRAFPIDPIEKKISLLFP